MQKGSTGLAATTTAPKPLLPRMQKTAYYTSETKTPSPALHSASVHLDLPHTSKTFVFALTNVKNTQEMTATQRQTSPRCLSPCRDTSLSLSAFQMDTLQLLRSYLGYVYTIKYCQQKEYQHTEANITSLLEDIHMLVLAVAPCLLPMSNCVA